MPRPSGRSRAWSRRRISGTPEPDAPVTCSAHHDRRPRERRLRSMGESCSRARRGRFGALVGLRRPQTHRACRKKEDSRTTKGVEAAPLSRTTPMATLKRPSSDRSHHPATRLRRRRGILQLRCPESRRGTRLPFQTNGAWCASLPVVPLDWGLTRASRSNLARGDLARGALPPLRSRSLSRWRGKFLSFELGAIPHLARPVAVDRVPRPLLFRI